MADNTVQIIFDAIDNSSQGVKSVIANLNKVGGMALRISADLGRMWDGLGKAVSDFQKISDKTGQSAEKAAAMSAAYEAVNESAENLKFTLMEIVAIPLAEFMDGLAVGVEGFGEMAEYIRNMTEIEAIADRMRAEQGKGKGTAYSGGRLGQSLKDDAEIFEAARLEWAKGKKELKELTEEERRLAAALEATQKAMAAESAANLRRVDYITRVQGAYDQLMDAQNKYIESLRDLQLEYAQGKINTTDYKKGIEEIEGAYASAKQASKEWAQSFIVDLYASRLAADGYMSDPDVESLLGFQVKLGMVDPNVASAVSAVVAAMSSGNQAEIDAAIAFFDKVMSPALPDALNNISDFTWPAPLGIDEGGRPFYSDETYAEYFAFLESLKNAPPPEMPAPELAGPQIAPPEIAAPGEEPKSVMGLEILNPETVGYAQQLMDVLSSVNTDGLDQAVADVKYLVSQDGRSITIYVETVQTTTTTAANDTPPPTGDTFINYGTYYGSSAGGTGSDSLAEWR